MRIDFDTVLVTYVGAQSLVSSVKDGVFKLLRNVWVFTRTNAADKRQTTIVLNGQGIVSYCGRIGDTTKVHSPIALKIEDTVNCGNACGDVGWVYSLEMNPRERTHRGLIPGRGMDEEGLALLESLGGEGDVLLVEG